MGKRYRVYELTYANWKVEDDEGKEHIVSSYVLPSGKVGFRCDCLYHAITKRYCSHIRAVLEFLGGDELERRA